MLTLQLTYGVTLAYQEKYCGWVHVHVTACVLAVLYSAVQYYWRFIYRAFLDSLF